MNTARHTLHSTAMPALAIRLDHAHNTAQALLAAGHIDLAAGKFRESLHTRIERCADLMRRFNAQRDAILTRLGDASDPHTHARRAMVIHRYQVECADVCTRVMQGRV